MRIHLIAIGGAIMHNLAISLQKAGHSVSGSDDEIYDPARSRLARHGLLPKQEGWDSQLINRSIDLVILGMHARATNPELEKALDLGLKVMSFPEFIADQSREKKRIVVTGSHGKTTTTAMIMHVLKELDYQFDYLVGAQLSGFDTMVQLSDAPVIILEGDEYLSSAIDRVPKIWHYRPQMAIITGIAWDHMNVFPTFDDYLGAFAGFLQTMAKGGKVVYFSHDPHLQELRKDYPRLDWIHYQDFDHCVVDGKTLLQFADREIPLQIFGRHNLANLRAAWIVLKELGVNEDQFLQSIQSFKGAAKRLQIIRERPDHVTYLDFAHAPSKVKATTEAVKQLYPQRHLTACVELHTYSSLNQHFIPLYRGSLDPADLALVYYDEHTLKMKKMEPLLEEAIKSAFGRNDLMVFTNREDLEKFLKEQEWSKRNLLLMSSGKFGGMDLPSITLVG